jgi:hypothetical protein
MRCEAETVAAKRCGLWGAGYRSVAVYTGGKRPKGNDWTDRARGDPPDAVTRPPDPDALNTGILCDGLRAVDMDIEDEALAAEVANLALDILGPWAAERYRDNSSRRLLLYRAAEGEPHKRIANGPRGKVEVLGKGQQFVAYGLHPSGAEIRWRNNDLENTPRDQLRPVTENNIESFVALVTTLLGGTTTHGANGEARDKQAPILEVIEVLARIPNDDGAPDWDRWNKVGMATFGATGGSKEGLNAFLGWSRQHPSFDEAHARERWANYRNSPPDNIGMGTLVYMARVAEGSAWTALLRRDRDDNIKGSESNMHLALIHAPELARAIAYDRREDALVALRPGPWGEAGPWTDGMTAQLIIWLQRQRPPIPAKLATVEGALAALARERQVDPLDDYLRGLVWDGEERLPTMLAKYFGAEDTKANRLKGRKFMISAAARALEPGVQADHTLALIGPQGAGKSQSVRILGGKYTIEGLPNLHDRDAQQLATSAWFIELSERSGFGRSATEEQKAFLTRRHDSFIPKYGRHKRTRPRWSCFIITMNPGNDLATDPSGGRRFWPVEVGRVDLAALARDRDQLFAEAVVRYECQEAWWPVTPEEEELLAGEQEEHGTEEAWDPLIEEWLAGQTQIAAAAARLTSDEYTRRWALKLPLESEPVVTTNKIATGALDIAVGNITDAVTRRIGWALRRLGWKRERRGPKGKRFYAYRPLAPPE